ncbi:hypothetical protein BJ165DRAFT_1410837 [Panaeolus papilionaceus]|nr:hypothetical protein BJ165DRAFT_1410837 [Panaeolus papilionaceus]
MFSALATALLLALPAMPVTAQAPNLPPGVIATGTMGPTNPPAPTMGTALNQSSDARLLSINGVDDFCLFAPPAPQDIGDSETFEVAWCTKQRNNARLIPDGTITGVSFLKTDFYVQIIGYGDLTKLNIPAGDFGGELDPHGAFGDGNPIGGNVTSNVLGSDMNFAEWMLYIDFNQFCIRVCTNANSTYSAGNMCWHELDEVGCGFVMPGNYAVNGTFETCDADVAYPPGWYPTATVNGVPQFSTFAQRFTGTLPGGSVYTIGDLTTPTAAFTTPSSSNCVTVPTISNGVALASLGLTQAGSAPAAATAAATGAPKAGSSSSGSGSSSSGSSSGSSGNSNQPSSASSNAQIYPVIALWAFLSGLGAVVLFH